MTKISSRKGYFLTLAIASLAIGILCFFAAFYGDDSNVLLIIGGTVLLIVAVFLFSFLTFNVAIYEDELCVNQFFSKTTVKAREITQIEWKFFEGRYGTCFINTESGKTVSLSRKMFNKSLKSKLMEF
ncbi:MAG: hypothetical protein RR177_06255, partial [Oscillospiraceae bacterium]